MSLIHNFLSSSYVENNSDKIVTHPIPDCQKNMTMDQVFWSHFSPNLGPGGWVTGIILASLHIDFFHSILAILIGNLLGAIPVAYAATIGPSTGLTQMEAAKTTFGKDGARIPAFLNWLYCVGWDAANNVPAAIALLTLLNMCHITLPFWLALLLLALPQCIASLYGHHIVQALQKYLGFVLLITFTIIGISTLNIHHTTEKIQPNFQWHDFILAIGIFVSFNLSWVSYSSDYTRYLPRHVNLKKVFFLALAGLLGSAVPFQILGLICANDFAQGGSPLSVIISFAHMPGVLAPLALASIALASISGNSFNDNTASYSLISAGLPLGRIISAFITATLGYILAVIGEGHYAMLYVDYLMITMYWIAPWTAIILADWYLSGHKTNHLVRKWTKGASIFLIVTLFTIIFFSTSEIYTGFLAQKIGNIDIGYYIGFLSALMIFTVSKKCNHNA